MAYPNIRKIPPTTIHEFRGYTDPTEPIVIPELAKKRKLTDVGFLVFFIFLLTATICVTGIASADTNYDRFVHGYDKCGDTCGVKNNPIKGVECSGKNLTGKPIMQMKYHKVKDKHLSVILPDICILKCAPQNQLYFQRCFPKSNASLDKKSENLKMFSEFVHDLKSSAFCIGAMCSTGLVSTLIVYVCFRFFAKATVVTILVLQGIASISFTAFVWYRYINYPDESGVLYIAITSTLFVAVMLLLVFYFHDKYDLIICMFEEATTAIFETPLLMLVPVMIIITLAVVTISSIFLTALISTNQVLKISKYDSTTYDYTMSTTASVSIGFLGLLDIWLFSFANGFQCMIVSGAITSHYFTRDRSRARYAVLESSYVVVRFHLGTVAFGSLIVTILVIIRSLIFWFKKRTVCKKIMICLKYRLMCVKTFVDYVTKRAYIESAMHGKSLYQSGMRAARLLWSNLLDTIGLDIVADFIVLCSLIMIMLLAAVVGLLMNSNENFTYKWTVLMVGAGATVTMVYFFMQVLNVATETIFLCYCEDKFLNDGKEKPYHMSPKLEDTINKAKQKAEADE